MVHLLTHTRNPCERLEVKRRCEVTIKDCHNSEALLDSASEFGNESRKSKEEKGGMSASNKMTGRLSAHSLGRESGALRSKRLKDGKTGHRRGTAKVFKGALQKDALKKGPEKKSLIGRVQQRDYIHEQSLPRLKRGESKGDGYRRRKARDM